MVSPGPFEITWNVKHPACIQDAECTGIDYNPIYQVQSLQYNNENTSSVCIILLCQQGMKSQLNLLWATLFKTSRFFFCNDSNQFKKELGCAFPKPTLDTPAWLKAISYKNENKQKGQQGRSVGLFEQPVLKCNSCTWRVKKIKAHSIASTLNFIWKPQAD